MHCWTRLGEAQGGKRKIRIIIFFHNVLLMSLEGKEKQGNHFIMERENKNMCSTPIKPSHGKIFENYLLMSIERAVLDAEPWLFLLWNVFMLILCSYNWENVFLEDICMQIWRTYLRWMANDWNIISIHFSWQTIVRNVDLLAITQ